MRKWQIAFLVIFAGCLLLFWGRLMDLIWPPKPKQESPLVKLGTQTASEGAALHLPDPNGDAVSDLGEAVVAESWKIRKQSYDIVAGVMKWFPHLGMTLVEPEPVQPQVKAPEVPSELIPLGHGDNPYYLKLLLNTRGGSVQQVILTAFDEADREGREVRVNGKPKLLHLVPGLVRPRANSLRAQREINEKEPELTPGKLDRAKYEELGYPVDDPSFVLFHYERAEDERPVDTLGNREWKVDRVSNDPNADEQYVVFKTELAEPHNLIIYKTFTLKRREYHIGMQVDIARLPGKTGPNKLRYQIQGAHTLPIEGEWYTSTYRQVIVGFCDDKGSTRRYIEDASQIREWEGSDRQTRTPSVAIRYAATTVQYFASAIAVDDQQENRGFVEYVRATPWGKPPAAKSGQAFLNDATVRTITEEFDPGKGVSHKYLLYQGPVKVRLLKQMAKGREVDDALVDRYLDRINLGTMTDGHMPNALGRFANAIFWSDLVIAFTNIIHSLLYYLYQIVPNLGICIILLTILVRGMLFPLSRRQAYNAQVMQAKMAKLQPELRKIQEKFKDDFQRLNQERMKLYKEHGINPFAALGGCFMLLLQMPVFMGLYYALQESVFFRLYDFIWMPNLAAPDMMFWWSESIPFISTPEDIGSTLYLGPFFNALPIIAVTLMLYQQKKMMPQSDDPQVQAQQRMMKFMMILFGLFFYKVAAGLCIYFVASSLWGLAERKFMPKAKPQDEESEETDGADNKKEKDEPPKPLGWWGRTKARWKEKWKKILEEAQKQAEYRREQNEKPPPSGGAGPTPPNRGGGGGGKKKKKKR